MFAISSMRPSLFRAEVSLLEPLLLFSTKMIFLCTAKKGNATDPHAFYFSGFTARFDGYFSHVCFRIFDDFPRGLPRKGARGAALRGHPGQVRMLQKMPKYCKSHFWSWGIRSILQNVLWLGSGSGPWGEPCSRRSTPRARNAGEAKTSCYSASRNSGAKMVRKR